MERMDKRPSQQTGDASNEVAPAGGGFDCHAHVFDTQRFPPHPSRAFDVLDSKAGQPEAFSAVLARSGFSGGLLVNPLGVYGTDNTCLLDTLSKCPRRFKGVAVLAHGTSDRELETMARCGVIGLRFNLNFPASPSLHSPGAQRTLAQARALGWFAQVHYEGDTLLDALPVLRASGLRLVIDHLGRPDPAPGARNAAFDALIRLGRESDAIVKLSGAFRLKGSAPPYEAAYEFVGRLIEAFGIDRCVWGSDWPFLRAPHAIDYPGLLRTLARWLPDAADREKVLSMNPARHFGLENKTAVV